MYSFNSVMPAQDTSKSGKVTAAHAQQTQASAPARHQLLRHVKKHMYKSPIIHCIAPCGSFQVHLRADVQKTCIHVLYSARGCQVSKYGGCTLAWRYSMIRGSHI